MSEQTNNILLNYSEASNEILQHTLKIAEEFYRPEIELIDILFSVLTEQSIFEYLHNRANIAIDKIADAYVNEISMKYRDCPASFKDLSAEAAKFIKDLQHNSLNTKEVVTAEKLVKNLLDVKDSIIAVFIQKLGLSEEDIIEAARTLDDYSDNDTVIPDELNGIVTDLNEYMMESDENIYNNEECIRDIVEILCRKKKCNPIIIGEPGIGKTTIVHSLAKLMNNGELSEYISNTECLANKRIYEVNSGLLTSGTKYRGEFERRLQVLLEFASQENVILFIDEFHLFLAAGQNGENPMSAGEVFKPYLANGKIKIIGATTPKEYHKYIEKDKAFERRLQPVMAKEPTVEEAIEIVYDTITEYENFHFVEIPMEIVERAVKLSDRYIKNKKLPDKAYMVLDQTASRCKLKNKNIEAADIDVTISKISGIDIRKISLGETKCLTMLEDRLSKRVIGQAEAVKLVADAVKRGKAGVQDMNKPVASFLFAGPTGVGKTELCKVLNDEMGNSKDRLIRFDMSEFSEPHSISKLIGSPAGYVGYGEGGQLTEAVKNNPDSIILLDEIEKANQSVFNLLLQILDDGRLTDSEGNVIDFRNTIIIMTSNIGYKADVLKDKVVGFFDNDNNDNSRAEQEKKEALDEIKKSFKPEFVNRIDDIVMFNRLNESSCEDIVKIQLNKLTDRLKYKDITVRFNNSLIKHLVSIGFDTEYGARNIKKNIKNIVENKLADEIVNETIKSKDTVSVSYVNNKVTIRKCKKKKGD